MMMLVSLILSLLMLNPPSLKVSLSPAQVITVSFDQSLIRQGVGMYTICTVFTSEDEQLDGAPYAPRHCWLFEEGDRPTYQDDWGFIPDGHAYQVQAILSQDATDPDIATNTVRVQR